VTPQAPLTRTWRTSSYSDSARQCVEVAQAGTACLVRDTKDRASAHLAFSPAAWAVFTRGIRNGVLLPAGG
jgi:Domain of unknown function (DUF397)